MAITKVERMREWLKNPDNYQRWLEGQRKRKQLLKENILTHYGNGKCACVACGENRLACLSIDHINGGGSKQRQGNLRAPNTFYRWLKTNDFPQGYQTLCMNCQFIKRVTNKEHS